MFVKKNKTPQTAKFFAPGEGESFSMMGIQISPKLSAEDTGGAYSMLEQIVSPGGGSPPHICHADDKSIYVVEGEFDILLGGETKRAQAGSFAIIPRGTVHSFTNTGAKSGKLLVSLTPAGHEKFLRELSQYSQDGAPDPEKMATITQTYQVEVVSSKE